MGPSASPGKQLGPSTSPGRQLGQSASPGRQDQEGYRYQNASGALEIIGILYELTYFLIKFHVIKKIKNAHITSRDTGAGFSESPLCIGN